MARDASTYRGSRRNYCHEQRMMWGPNWYYGEHSAKYLTHEDWKKRSSARAELHKQHVKSLREMAISATVAAKSLIQRFSGRKGMAAGAPRARSAGRGQ